MISIENIKLHTVTFCQTRCIGLPLKTEVPGSNQKIKFENTRNENSLPKKCTFLTFRYEYLKKVPSFLAGSNRRTLVGFIPLS